MQAVGCYWAQLEFVRGPIPIDDDFRCVMIPPPDAGIRAMLESMVFPPFVVEHYQREQRGIDSVETFVNAPPQAGVYEQLMQAAATRPVVSEPLNMQALMDSFYYIKRIRQVAESNTFTVFFPSDEKMALFCERSGAGTSGLERNISWWAVKRGIDFSRIRRCRVENGQAVIDVMSFRFPRPATFLGSVRRDRHRRSTSSRSQSLCSCSISAFGAGL